LVLLIVNETRRIAPLRQLLAAGRNVFTEKPLCGLEGQGRVREEDAAIAAPAIREWRKSGLKFGINYNYRFMKHFAKLHDDVAQGRLGQIKLVRAWAHFACWSHLIDQILWDMGPPEWVSVLGDPKESGNWSRLVRMKWANGALGTLDGTDLWGGEENLLSLMILGDKTYAEAKGIDGWYRRAKSNAWNQQVEELWKAEKTRAEMNESFVRMADGVIKAMQANQPFPADGNAAWNELLLEAAIHRSALKDGERVYLPEMEKALLGG
jgi:predicted dehydrogenase